MKIKGIYTPIVTPFGKNNEIDYESLERQFSNFFLKNKSMELSLGERLESIFL